MKTYIFLITICLLTACSASKSFKTLYLAAGKPGGFGLWTCSNIFTDCAYYPDNKKLVVINNADKVEKTKVNCADGKSVEVTLEPYGLEIIDL